MSALNPIFTKYHANGNDFIIFDMSKRENRSSQHLLTNAAKELCRRHFGIGADGVILLDREHEQFLMTIINADGSVAKNCGNGLGCAAEYIFKQTATDEIFIKLFDRVFHCRRESHDISVFMGQGSIQKPERIYLENAKCHGFFSRVHIGNEHAVFLLDQPMDISFDLVNEVLKTCVIEKTVNVGFLYRDSTGHYCGFVYEAGVGFTKSCGSGACAAALMLALDDDRLLNEEIAITQPGGQLNITVRDKNKAADKATFNVSLRTKVIEVFTGNCLPALLREENVNSRAARKCISQETDFSNVIRGV